MINVLGTPSSRRAHGQVTRRHLLQAGGLSVLSGLGGAAGAGEESSLPRAFTGPAKSVILLFLHGGAATQDMWDLKPGAPAEIRGEFQPIDTNVPGIRISEHLPRTSKWLHKMALIRSVNHRAACHNTLPAFTGQEIVVPVQNQADPSHSPSMGSVCEYLEQQAAERNARGGGAGDAARLPAYACVPSHLGFGEYGRRPGIYGGFLGQRFDPFCSDCDPHLDKDADKQNRAHPPELRGQPRMPAGSLQGDLTLDRLHARKSLLEQIDEQFRRQDAGRGPLEHERVRRRAYELITSTKLRAAFDLDQETPATRDRYGRSLFGSSVLTARRLVEAGVRFVNVFWDNFAPRLQYQDYGWDTHMYNFQTLRGEYLPWLDRTYSALLEDLDARGLLDETLVVVRSDFGRTPNINKDAGRDHWTFCYTEVLAGAGVRGGTVYGESDAHAAFVKDKPASTGDVCATIYRCLGIDPQLQVHDRLGRPHAIAQGGRAIEEVLVRG